MYKIRFYFKKKRLSQAEKGLIRTLMSIQNYRIAINKSQSIKTCKVKTGKNKINKSLSSKYYKARN